MVVNTVLFCYAKKFEKTSKAIFVWYPKERADLKIIHVLTDDVFARNFLKKSKHACIYIQNGFPRGFRLLNHIWGDYFKWAKIGSLNVFIHPFIYCGNFGTRWIQTFPRQQTWHVLQWRKHCSSHIWSKCTTSFQGLPVIFQAVL